MQPGLKVEFAYLRSMKIWNAFGWTGGICVGGVALGG